MRKLKERQKKREAEREEINIQKVHEEMTNKNGFFAKISTKLSDYKSKIYQKVFKAKRSPLD